MTPLIQPNVKKIATVFSALFLLGALIFYGYHQNKAQQAQSDLLNLQQYAQRLALLQSTLPPPESRALPLTTLIEQSTMRHRLTPTAITPDPEEDALSITLPPLPFSKLIAWLADLQREHDIQVQTLQVTPLPSPGVVRVDVLRLQRLFSQ